MKRIDPHVQAAAMAEYLRVLHDPNDLIEVRAMNVDRYGNTLSGYFRTDSENLIDELARNLSCDGKPVSFYQTMNDFDGALYSRSQHEKIKRVKKEPTTSDKDVRRLRWILVDADPVRCSGVSSTDEEKAEALKLIDKVRRYLSGNGFSDPVLADSGNGYHLLYRIDADPAFSDDVKTLLEDLADRFNTERVKIDTVNFNPARITKLYGTYAVKGADTAERPWRQSGILEVPNGGAVVTSCDVITAFVESLKDVFADPDQSGAECTGGGKSQSQTVCRGSGSASERFDVRRFISENGLSIAYEKYDSDKHRTKLILDQCPFDSNHRAPDAMIGVCDDGKLQFHCFHDGCAGKRWSDVRRLFDPDYDRRKAEMQARFEQGKTAPPTAAAQAAAQVSLSQEKDSPITAAAPPMVGGEFFDMSDLIGDNLQDLSPEIIAGVLRRGHIGILSGASKIGKTFASIELSIAVANGQRWFGFQCQRGNVLYVNFEVDSRSFANRFDKVARSMGATVCNGSVKLYQLRGVHSTAGSVCDELKAFCKSWVPDLIVVDPVYRLVEGDENNATDVARMFAVMDNLATETGAAVVLIHHHSKGGQAGKASMDRASGSGVFARSPDAVIDMLEIEIDDAMREKLEKVYRVPIAGCTGFRLSMTLREFRTPKPIHGWFGYPTHHIDSFEYLKTARPMNEARAADARRQANRRKVRDWKNELEKSFGKFADHCNPDTGGIHVDIIAADIGCAPSTLRNYTAAAGFKIVRNEIMPLMPILPVENDD